MAVSNEALTTLANVKAELDISVSTYDTKLETWINRATSWIQSQTGRKMKARNYNGFGTAFNTTSISSEDYLFFDGSQAVVNDEGRGEFWLPQFPIQRSSVSGALVFELAYLTDRGSSGDTYTAYTEGEEYIVDYDRGIARLTSGHFSEGLKRYRVRCTAGYLVGDAQPYMPNNLEGLCIEMVRMLYEDKKNLQSEKIGTWSRTFDTAKKDPWIDDTLSIYTRLT